MKANELRIGNWVEHPHLLNGKEVKYGQVVDISDYDVIEGSTGVIAIKRFKMQSSNHFQPIPLTEEWLVKFGFEKDETNLKMFNKKSTTSLVEYYFILDGYNFGLYNELMQSEIHIDLEVKYVHQLQNLYFALTGDELTIKEL